MHPKDADRMANSVDVDQTACSSLIWVYTVCLDISVRTLRIITVSLKWNVTYSKFKVKQGHLSLQKDFATFFE